MGERWGKGEGERKEGEGKGETEAEIERYAEVSLCSRLFLAPSL